MVTEREVGRRLGRLSTLVLAGLLATGACKGSRSGVVDRIEDGVTLRAPSKAEQDAIARFVVARLSGDDAGELPALLQDTQAVAYVALRSRGVVLGQAWGPPGDAALSLSAALNQALESLEQPEIDTVEIDLAHDFHAIEPATPEKLKQALNSRHLGMRGVELTYGDTTKRFAPTVMISENRRYEDEIERFMLALEIDAAELADRGQVRHFRARQLLVEVPSGETTLLFRGNAFVPPSAVDQQRAREAAELASAWMLANLHDDGRMTYRWLPSSSSEGKGNDAARQWLATWALIQLARRRDVEGRDAALWQRVDRNLEHNLREWFRGREGLGLIEQDGKVTLAGLALARLAILEHPQHERWAAQAQALDKTIDALWRPDGRFDCHYPATADQAEDPPGCPAEALLVWAYRYAKERDAELLRRFAISHRHAVARHREQVDGREPTRVAWHALASAKLWTALREPGPASEGPSGQGEPAIRPEELAAWVLEANDWQVDELAVWDKAVYEDERGRFFSRTKSYGPPSVALSGLVMQSLVAGWRIAVSLGDRDRAERYRLTLARGLRGVLQLQFSGEDDLFWVRSRERTRGGLRSSVFNNEIRVDNVQQVLMASFALLDTFSPDDYRCE